MTPEQRLAAVRSLLEKRPDDPFARYSLAMALRSTGDLAQAISQFRDLARRAPDYVPTWLMLGQTLEQSGDAAAALSAYEEGAGVARRCGEAHAQSELVAAAEELRARGIRGTTA